MDELLNWQSADGASPELVVGVAVVLGAVEEVLTPGTVRTERVLLCRPMPIPLKFFLQICKQQRLLAACWQFAADICCPCLGLFPSDARCFFGKQKQMMIDPALPNGLATPALALGPSGAVRFVYAGDLQGNLWRFNFTGDAPWGAALASDTPLFVAQDENGVRQPITTQPRVVFAPGGGFVVLFGTGKFLEEADAAIGNFKHQSFYGIYDTTAAKYSVSSRAELAARSLSSGQGDAVTIAGDAFVYGLGDDEKKGWYFDFIDSEKTGERSVTNPLVVDGVLYFNSLIPSGDPCAPGGGRSYMLNTLSGLVPDAALTGQLSRVGMPSSPVPLETAVEIGDRNAIGRRIVKKTHTVFNFGTGGSKGVAAQAESGSQDIVLPAGRFSWREILNWLELKQSSGKNN